MEESLRRHLPIITMPHAKSHLSSKLGKNEAFTAVTDFDFFESVLIDIEYDPKTSKAQSIKK